MSEASSKRLTELVEAADVDGIVAHVTGLSEPERRALAPAAIAAWKKHRRHDWIEVKKGTFKRDERELAAPIALPAVCTLAELRRLGLDALPGPDTTAKLIADRRPPWVAELVEELLEGGGRRWGAWAIVWELLSGGLIDEPPIQHDGWVAGLVYGFGRSVCGPRLARDRGALADELAEHLELLEPTIWRLFEVEGGGEESLAAHDKYSAKDWTWIEGLATLAERGRLDRSRLIDASLDALERDFAAFRAGWFGRFHERLAPTLDERAERAPRYIDLLASGVKTTVSFALKALEALAKGKRLDGAAFVAGVFPALRAEAKGTVKKALAMLARVAKTEKTLKLEVARAAAPGLSHEAVDVQENALELLEKLGDPADPETAEVVDEMAEHVAASLRKRLAAWRGSGAGGDHGAGGGAPAEPADPAGAVDAGHLRARTASLPEDLVAAAGIPALLDRLDAGELGIERAPFAGHAVPRLDPDATLAPITEVDELIDVAAAALETPEESADDAERVLDALSRLARERPDDLGKRAGPLRKRAQQLLDRHQFGEPFRGHTLTADVAGVVIAWVDRAWPRVAKKEPSKQTAARTLMELLGQRSRAVAARLIAGEAAPLLSAPTHRGGFIAAPSLVERVAALDAAKREADPTDAALALLRLAPDRREAALASAAKLAGELGRAVRYALGGRRGKIGPLAALWCSAARARVPGGDDPTVSATHDGLGPDGARAARYTPAIRARKSGRYTFRWLELAREPSPPAKSDPFAAAPMLHRAGFEDERDAPGGWSIASYRWASLAWPLGREAWAALGAVALAHNLDWGGAEWENRVYLEHLVAPDADLGPMAALLLALGLAAKEPGESGLATDIAIAAIEDGRADGETLGAAMAFLVPTGIVLFARWAKTLAEVARVSPLHAWVIQDAIERALPDDAKESPRDRAALVELLRELAIDAERAITRPGARAFLESLRGSSKAARAARATLAAEGDGAERGRAAMLAALQGRVERAERWARWRGDAG